MISATMNRAALAFRSCSPRDDDELSRGSVELLLPRPRSVLCNGHIKAGPNLVVPVRSSTPLHRVGLNWLT